MKKTTSAMLRTGISSPPGTFTKDSTIFTLQQLESPPQTAIYEPSMEFDSFGQTSGAAAVHLALTQYLTGWFGFPVMQTWDFDYPAAILIVDEIHLPTLLAQKPDFLDRPSRQSMIILCANPARQSILSRDIRSHQVEIICKPFGPFKLAKTLHRALDKASKRSETSTPLTAASLSSLGTLSRLPGISSTHRSGSTSSHRSSSATSSGTAASKRRPMREPFYQGSSRHKARSRVRQAVAGPDDGYPFPVVASSSVPGRSHIPSPTYHHLQHGDKVSFLSPPGHPQPSAKDIERVPDVSAKTSPAEDVKIKDEHRKGATTSGEAEITTRLRPGPVVELKAEGNASPGTTGTGSFTSSDVPKIVALPAAASFPKKSEPKSAVPSPSAAFQSTNTGALGIWDPPNSLQTRKPRLLLVDDNKLNLQLLHTFVKKREYGEELCQLAEDGSQAVDAFESFSPDVVFMDISMPVLDGIEATRQIRKLEANRRDSDLREKTPIDEAGPRPNKPALVVALTGNVSTDTPRDSQSGC